MVNILGGTGELYDIVTEIAQKIWLEDEKQVFFESVPSCINQFINNGFGEQATTADKIWVFFSFTMDAVAGIVLYVPKVLFLIVPGAIIETIETMLAGIGNENGFLGIDKFLTIDHIFFNKVPLTDINIFDFEKAANSTLSDGNVLLKLRQNIADWYYSIRNLAIALSLAVLIYIGIRMATSAIAEDKAKYKKMFMDWLISFALIFVLQYLMIFVIQLNEGIVEVLAQAHDKQGQELAIKIPIVEATHETETLQGRLLAEAFHPLLTRSMAATLLYIAFVAMTFLFLIVYIKRFVTLSFLAIISPLITVTYAIDKAGDGKAQALNKWLKEFVFNILIQPFHCIIYMVFAQNIIHVISDTVGILNFGKVFIAIIMLGFIHKAEDIVKSIFGFEAHNLSSAAALGIIALNSASKIGKLKSTMSGVKDAGDKLKQMKAINKNAPNTLPSQARNMPAPASTQTQTNSRSTDTRTGQWRSRE